MISTGLPDGFLDKAPFPSANPFRCPFFFDIGSVPASILMIKNKGLNTSSCSLGKNQRSKQYDNKTHQKDDKPMGIQCLAEVHSSINFSLNL